MSFSHVYGAALKPFRDKIVIGMKFGIQFDWTSTATNLPVMTNACGRHATAYRRGKNKVCPVTAIQNRYSMMARWHEKFFTVLEELNIGYVATVNGLLSGAYNKDSKFAAKIDYRSAMPQFFFAREVSLTR